MKDLTAEVYPAIVADPHPEKYPSIQELMKKLPDGVWKEEPNFAFWVDEKTGFPCLILRSIPTWALNGYVGVPKNHPLSCKDYDDIPDAIHEASHQGLTYAGFIETEHEELANFSDYWFFGFDCAHYGDFMPLGIYPEYFHEDFKNAFGEDPMFNDKYYRDMGYVSGKVKELAEVLGGIND